MVDLRPIAGYVHEFGPSARGFLYFAAKWTRLTFAAGGCPALRVLVISRSPCGNIAWHLDDWIVKNDLSTDDHNPKPAIIIMIAGDHKL